MCYDVRTSHSCHSNTVQTCVHANSMLIDVDQMHSTVEISSAPRAFSGEPSLSQIMKIYEDMKIHRWVCRDSTKAWKDSAFHYQHHYSTGELTAVHGLLNGEDHSKWNRHPLLSLDPLPSRISRFSTNPTVNLYYLAQESFSQNAKC